LNIFIDESGSFDFSAQGTKHFILTAVSATQCADLFAGFFDLKQRIATTGLDLEEFHATNDRQAVRDQMYAFLEQHCDHDCFTIDSIIAQNPTIREPAVFYAKLLRILLKWVFRSRVTGEIDQVLVWAARIGTHKKRVVFEKTVKQYLSNDLETRVSYHLFIHSASSHPMLQVADYCCWAVAKKWKDGELRPYSKIKKALKTEFDVFKRSREEYY
jgi:hypothetical protein